MRTSFKILLGLAALSPFVFAAAFIAVSFLLLSNAPVDGFEEYFSRYAWMINLASSLFTLFYLGILVIYVLHAARNQNLENSGMRTTWLIAICILGPWVMPFYWFNHIWRDGVQRGRSGPLGLN